MVKPATSYIEQMNILKSRNIQIKDEQFCLDVLSQLNYYRLTAYMLPYKVSDDKYSPIAFEQIYHTYEFDRKLRSLIVAVLEEIELGLRTKLAYYHTHTYGALGYIDDSRYNKQHKHAEFLQEFERLVLKNKDNLFVKHHLENKNGEFPLWVAVELFPFGMLSRFYADLPVRDKKYFARTYYEVGYEQFESWLLCISTLRNRCAHYMRLYFYNFNKWPKPPKDSEITIANTIFDYIYIIRYCYLDKSKWAVSFFTGLTSLMEEYEQYISLSHIGFPINWRKLLS